jgi:hypothetical protein
MNQFTKSPLEVNISYLQPMRYAFTYTGRFGMITFCCLIHHFFTFLFTNITTKIIKQLPYNFENRNNH